MKNSKAFRDLPKEDIEFRLPVELAGQIRERAVRQRRSISEVGVELMAIGLRIDPSRFGIDSEMATT